MASATGVIVGEVATRTMKIDTNLSSKEGYFVNFDASDEDTVNIAADASALPLPLVEGMDGSSTAGVGTVAVGGIVKIKAGANVSAGDKVTSDSAGKGITTTTDTDHYGGYALEAAVTGDEFKMLISPGMVAG